MKKKLIRFQFAGFLFTSVFGALLHFVYAAGGKSPILAAIASVNESTWEHMKLLFFPSFLFALFEYAAIGRRFAEYWRAKLAGITLGTLMIPVFFYTVGGAFGKVPDVFNIISFFLSAGAEYVSESHMLLSVRFVSMCCAGGDFPCVAETAAGKECRVKKRRMISERAAFAALCVIALAFILFTFRTPRLPLFCDPLSSGYGIQG